MNLNQNANKSFLHYIKCYLKRSGQFPSPSHCSWSSQTSFPTRWTAPDSVIPTPRIAGGFIKPLPPCNRRLAPATVAVVRLTLLTHSPGSLLEPWGTHLEEQETNPSLTPSQSPSFFFKKTHSASPQGCSQSRLSPPASAASYKWILDQIIQLLPPPFLANF